MNYRSNETPSQHHFFLQENLPNSTAVLVLGILSIFGCCFYGIPGLVLSIIALVLAKSDSELYRQNPSRYNSASYNNLKAGRVCASVTISLLAVGLLFIIFIIFTAGFSSLTNTDYF